MVRSGKECGVEASTRRVEGGGVPGREHGAPGRQKRCKSEPWTASRIHAGECQGGSMEHLICATEHADQGQLFKLTIGPRQTANVSAHVD